MKIRKNKSKKDKYSLVELAIIVGGLAGAAAILFPKNDATETARITDVKGLSTAATELSNTNIDAEIDSELEKLDQDASNL